VAARLQLNVLVVSNGSRPIRPPGTSNVRMVLVADSADAADDWIAEHISAADVRHLRYPAGSTLSQKRGVLRSVRWFFRGDRDGAPVGQTPSEHSPSSPIILCLRISPRLPLHICDRIWATTLERLDVVLDVTRARSARATIGRTRVRQLELALDRSRPVLFGRSGDWQGDADGQQDGGEKSGSHGSPNLAPGPSAGRHSAASG
jgi:hypothetical protein